MRELSNSIWLLSFVPMAADGKADIEHWAQHDSLINRKVHAGKSTNIPKPASFSPSSSDVVVRNGGHTKAQCGFNENEKINNLLEWKAAD